MKAQTPPPSVRRLLGVAVPLVLLAGCDRPVAEPEEGSPPPPERTAPSPSVAPSAPVTGAVASPAAIAPEWTEPLVAPVRETLEKSKGPGPDDRESVLAYFAGAEADFERTLAALDEAAASLSDQARLRFEIARDEALEAWEAVQAHLADLAAASDDTWPATHLAAEEAWQRYTFALNDLRASVP